MFTSLFQLEQKPVTVFSSDDAGAPVLSKDAGSLKSLLKACLVTGYGDKTSLGWQMLFESADTLSAAFASTDPTASKFVLKINNSTSASAKISAYQSMTDIDTGVKPLAVNNEYELFDGSWRLIGHSKAFILLLNASSYGGEKIAYPILFGDLPRETKRTAPVVVFWTARKTQYIQGSLQTTLQYYPGGQQGSGTSDTNAAVTSNYPVVVNGADTKNYIKQAFSKFSAESTAAAANMYDPYIMALPDATWTILSMLQPTSNMINAVSNLGTVSASLLKARTSNFSVNKFNGDCVVPTDWWWA